MVTTRTSLAALLLVLAIAGTGSADSLGLTLSAYVDSAPVPTIVVDPSPLVVSFGDSGPGTELRFTAITTTWDGAEKSIASAFINALGLLGGNVEHSVVPGGGGILQDGAASVSLEWTGDLDLSRPVDLEFEIPEAVLELSTDTPFHDLGLEAPHEIDLALDGVPPLVIDELPVETALHRDFEGMFMLVRGQMDVSLSVEAEVLDSVVLLPGSRVAVLEQSFEMVLEKGWGQKADGEYGFQSKLAELRMEEGILVDRMDVDIEGDPPTGLDPATGEVSIDVDGNADVGGHLRGLVGIRFDDGDLTARSHAIVDGDPGLLIDPQKLWLKYQVDFRVQEYMPSGFHPGGSRFQLIAFGDPIRITIRNAIPEPGSFVLLVVGALALVGYRLRRRE